MNLNKLYVYLLYHTRNDEHITTIIYNAQPIQHNYKCAQRRRTTIYEKTKAKQKKCELTNQYNNTLQGICRRLQELEGKDNNLTFGETLGTPQMFSQTRW